MRAVIGTIHASVTFRRWNRLIPVDRDSGREKISAATHGLVEGTAKNAEIKRKWSGQ